MTITQIEQIQTHDTAPTQLVSVEDVRRFLDGDLTV
jgi:hypothetical protein